jgi:polysaccharide pyruvyl transferase WcaK-like protein
MIKIVHFSFNGKYNTNIGDQAHVLAIQESLSFLSDEKIEFIDVPIKLIGKYLIPNLWYYPGAKHYPGVLQRIYQKLSGYSYNRILKDCNNSSLVLIGGGGVFMGQFLPFNNRFINSIERPVALFGVGYNQNLHAKNLNNAQVKSVVTLSNKARVLTVRDEMTQNFLKDIGVDSSLMCDPAIFLSEKKVDFQIRDDDSLKIGINLAHHGWTDMNIMTERIVDCYTSLIKEYHKLPKNVQFIYFMHEPGEKYIIERFNSNGIFFDLIIQAKDSRELKYAYRKMDFTISMMLHSTVLAFGAGTPSISIGYDKKNKSFMKLTNQQSRYISIDDITPKLLKVICDDLVHNLEEINTGLANTKNNLNKIFIRRAKEVLSLAAS